MEKSMEKATEEQIKAMAEAMGGDGDAGKVVQIVAANERFREGWEMLQMVMGDFLTLAHGDGEDGKMVQMGFKAQKILSELMKLEPKPYTVGQ